MKSMVNLHNSCNEGVDVNDDLLLSTGLLGDRSMYGTLPAAASWQDLVQKVGTDIGLLSSSNCPCALGHSSRDLDMVVHGDDFIVAGCGDDLDWLS